MILFVVDDVNASAVPCRTPQQMEAAVRPLSTPSRYTGTAAQQFIAAFNEFPPPSSVVADEVLIFTHARVRSGLVMMFKNGCVVRIEQMSLSALHTLHQKIGQSI